MTIDADLLLEPAHVLYRGAGEYTKRAKALRGVFYALDDIQRLAWGLDGSERLSAQVRDQQRMVLTELHAIDAMLEDPNLRWFMKSGFLDN
tara:strand:+ start:230 stop:502 length:273 start_codon:yes stop_codon:yes gene_type:complete